MSINSRLKAIYITDQSVFLDKSLTYRPPIFENTSELLLPHNQMRLNSEKHLWWSFFAKS